MRQEPTLPGRLAQRQDLRVRGRVLAPLALVAARADHLAVGTTTAPTGTSSCSSARSASAIASAHEAARRRGCHAERAQLSTQLGGCRETSALPTMFYGCSAAPVSALPHPPCSEEPLLSAALGAAPARPRPPTRRALRAGRGRRALRGPGRRAPPPRSSGRAPGEALRETIAGLHAQPRRAEPRPNVIARAALMPNDPGRAGIARRLAADPVELHRPVRRERPARLGPRSRAVGPPGGRGVVGRRARHRRRLRRPRPLPPLARPARQPLRARLRLRRRRHAPRRPQRPRHARRRRRSPRATNNGVGVTGLAYGAQIMPVRVLDRHGEGDAATIAKGIRYAAKHGAEVHQPLASSSARPCARGEIPDILDALRYAHRKGVLVVGAAGNEARARRRLPRARQRRRLRRRHDRARLPRRVLELRPRARPRRPGRRRRRRRARRPELPPGPTPGRDIYQMTFTRNGRRFGLPGRYDGHVDGRAARRRDRGARDRLAACSARPEPAQVEAPAEGDRARPRPAGPGQPLRRRAARRRARRPTPPPDRSDDQHRAGTASRRSSPCCLRAVHHDRGVHGRDHRGPLPFAPCAGSGSGCRW